MDKAKVFMSGNSQAIRLPHAYRLTDEYVYIKQVGSTLVLIPASKSWEPLLESLSMFSDDFMEDRNQPELQVREDLFE